jgi:Family of unknown function (DUF6236)
MNATAATAFERDWKGLLADGKKRSRSIRRSECSVPIYKDKTSQRIFDDLKNRGLARETTHPLLYFFEPSTAMIYMALLAKHMAEAQPNPTIPGTDRERLSNLTFGKNSPGNLEPVLSALLADVIPIPSSSVPLKTILGFRQKYQPELMAFRAVIEDFEKTLVAAFDKAEVISLTENFKERIARETIELGKALKSTRISTLLGSLQAFIKPTSPTLIGSAAIVAGRATSLADLPISWVMAGAACAGLVEVGLHWFGKVQERRKALRDTPFAYLFLARKKLIRL